MSFLFLLFTCGFDSRVPFSALCAVSTNTPPSSLFLRHEVSHSVSWTNARRAPQSPSEVSHLQVEWRCQKLSDTSKGLQRRNDALKLNFRSPACTLLKMLVHQHFRGARDGPIGATYGGRPANDKAQKWDLPQKWDLRRDDEHDDSLAQCLRRFLFWAKSYFPLNICWTASVARTDWYIAWPTGKLMSVYL